jgi:hypothetical protein
MAWENTTADNLGITATHVRRIKSGAEYEKYFEPATGETITVNENATVHDTLAFVGELVKKTLNDTKKIAQVLKRPTLEATCKSVFDFFYQHYQYKLDDYGFEQVRRPSRAWADRKTGIDCDCFTASVSSILTNLGIAHHLKIIAINGRENFQHIYVVVEKRQGLDINSRANYWVIDPVLNSFDEEAPKITKTKHLIMEGIPLQQLNGIDTMQQLGNEFEGVDTELNGLDEQGVGRVFHQRLHAHIRNTRCHCQQKPHLYRSMYNQPVLLKQLQKLEGALASGSEAHLDGVLEELSNSEKDAVLPHLHGVYDEIHAHDDHLYGHQFGAIDEKMLDTVMGLGRRSKKKGGFFKKMKRGFFTKIKNARKAFKSGKWKGKLKGAFKKIGRFLKKTNPLAMAIRGGFLMAMRTNFLHMGEKVYWGFQTKEYALKRGIKPDYYDACLKVKTRLINAYVNKLGGNESAIKKAVMNGRAAKKIAKLLKAKGMSGTTEALFGMDGLGSAIAAGASITAAMAALAPILKMISGLFKGKKSGLEKTETGGEAPAPGDNPNPSDTSETSNPSNTTITNDGSIESADKANGEAPSSEDTDGEKKKGGDKSRNDANRSDVTTDTNGSDATEPTTGERIKQPNEPVVDENGNPKPASKTGLIVGLLGIAGLAAIALMGKKGKPKTKVDGLGNFSEKRESKALKALAIKAGVKMPHGYQVKKRKVQKVKTIKI